MRDIGEARLGSSDMLSCHFLMMNGVPTHTAGKNHPNLPILTTYLFSKRNLRRIAVSVNSMFARDLSLSRARERGMCWTMCLKTIEWSDPQVMWARFAQF